MGFACPSDVDSVHSIILCTARPHCQSLAQWLFDARFHVFQAPYGDLQSYVNNRSMVKAIIRLRVDQTEW
jgi:hypothetical protein